MKAIAEKGLREAVKVDKQTLYNLNRVAAARAQAEKFQQHDKSGRYQDQLQSEVNRSKTEGAEKEPGDD